MSQFFGVTLKIRNVIGCICTLSIIQFQAIVKTHCLYFI